MKTKILFFLFLSIVSSTNLHSQSYDSMVVSTKIWSHVSGYYDPNSIEGGRKTTFIKFAVDPTITTIDEKQVLVSEDSLKTWTKVGNIKEVDKKVYFRNLENKQGLLYDFSLKKGDSINTVNTYLQFMDSITYKVINVDTVNYFGINRTRLEIRAVLYSCRDYWIEGIGSVSGLFRTIFCMPGGFSKLLCVHENSNQIYQNPQRNTCYELDNKTEIKEISKSEFHIFPNPTSGKIYLDGLSETPNLNMSVYSVLGTLIYRQNIMTKEIDLNLEKGIYILSFQGKDNFHYKQTITIH